MDARFHISVSPHIRGPLTTRSVMTDMLVALLPTTIISIWVHGVAALVIILASVLTAVVTEYLFDRVTKRDNTIDDLSAVVTGLLLALTLPGQVPLYIPVFGAVFAILVVKCLFGGLGHNIVNPALAGRCFLLISFGAAMTGYTVDGVSAATPLAELAAGNSVDLLTLALGHTSGVIGSSALGLIAGGIYLLICGGITWEIPVSMIASTVLFMGFFGGRGFDMTYLLPHTLGGGLLMAAFFMATDPVSCPSTSWGQIAFGAVAGILCGLLRVLGGAADSTTYAILLADLLGPIIDDVVIPLPYAYRPHKKKFSIPKPVVTLVVIVLIAGLALSGVFAMTKDTIEANQLQANAAAFQVVLPEAVDFAAEEDLAKTIEEMDGAAYGGGFGNSFIEGAITGKSADGTVVGYVIQVSSTDCYEDSMSLVVGITTDGTVNAIAFTDLHDTPGMGMLCGEPAFMDQFAGVKVPAFTLVKGGGTGAEGSVDSVSGASTTSGAVVNAVNAALDFYANNIG